MMSHRTRLVGLALAVVTALPGASVVGVAAAAVADEPAFSANPRPHSVSVDWVDAMLEAIELNPPAPTATTWRMWVVLSSMYDAWAAYDDDALATATGSDLKRPAAERTIANQERAASYAAHNALSYAYPEQVAVFDAVLELHDLAPSGSHDPQHPEGVGNLAADAVIRARLADASNAGTFADLSSATYPQQYQPAAGGDPNRWVPLVVPTGAVVDGNGLPVWSRDDPSSFETQTFLTPHWGAVTPFALTAGDQFRPAPPPRLGSDAPYVDAQGGTSTNDEAFRAQAAEVLALSGELDDRHKVIAEFWADGPHSWTPPGHWVQLAVGVSLRDRHTLEQDICMFLALGGALLDAGIAAWDAKRAYDYVRPATAIPYLYGGSRVRAWAGPNLGTRDIDASEWRPYQAATFVTPPFAEYVSGHSTFSRAAAEVLTGYTGSERMYDGRTLLGRDYDGDGVEDLFGQHIAAPGTLAFETGPSSTVALRWQTFREAADEAGVSRLYGGIHFQDADLRGRVLGSEVGRRALEHARALWDPVPG